MARILYGIISIGLGHAMRSKAVIDHLIKKKHDVMILTSHNVYDYYKKNYKNVKNIEGLEIVFKKNTILNVQTLVKNLEKISRKTYDKFTEVKDSIEKFDPQIVISDMETFSTYVAHDKKLPLISIDNQHFLEYGKFHVPEQYRLSYLKALMVVRSIVLEAKYHVIMAFDGNRIVEKPNLFLVKPVLRKEILEAKTKSENYVFVYQSTKSYDKLIDILKRINYKFIIYGFDKDAVVGNLIFKKFNDSKNFIKDLTNSKAVITNGGFTLISEAMYLKKPMLIVPIKKHFEQIINALYIKENKLGEFYTDLTEKHVVEFLMNLKKYRTDKLKKWDNEQAFRLIETLINKETK
jgi:uncharacterized protein (TIGR00661 family)